MTWIENWFEKGIFKDTIEEENKKELYNTDITELNLSTRPFNALKRIRGR